MLNLACSTLCFTQLSLDAALQRIRQLGFRYVDLGVQQWSHLSAAELASAGDGIVTSLRHDLAQADLTLSAMNAALDRSAGVSLEEQVAAACVLAASHDVRAICINAPANETPLGTAIVELRQLAAIAGRYGVVLCIETHINCLTEIPAAAVRLVESEPNLGLALDPSHFYAGPWQGRDFSITFPHSRIVHLRDAGNSPDKILVPPGEGIVDFAGILRGLLQSGYAGPLSVEYIDTRVSPDRYIDHVTQVKEMASLARSTLAELQAPPA